MLSQLCRDVEDALARKLVQRILDKSLVSLVDLCCDTVVACYILPHLLCELVLRRHVIALFMHMFIFEAFEAEQLGIVQNSEVFRGVRLAKLFD